MKKNKLLCGMGMTTIVGNKFFGGPTKFYGLARPTIVDTLSQYTHVKITYIPVGRHINLKLVHCILYTETDFI